MESNLLLLIKLERLCYSWDEENAEAEWIVKGENETSGKNKVFLTCMAFLIENVLIYVLMALVFMRT